MSTGSAWTRRLQTVPAVLLGTTVAVTASPPLLAAAAVVRKAVDARITRVPYDSIPTGRQERIAWLHGVWQEMGDWVSEERVASDR